MTASRPPRVLIAVSVRFYREGLERILRGDATLDVVATAADLASMVEMTKATDPEIVLLDLKFEERLSTVAVLRRVAPDARVVGLAVDENADVISWAEAGVSSFVTPDTAVEGLADVIRAAMDDELTCSPRVAATLLRRVGHLAGERSPVFVAARLTERERQVLSLIADGLSNKDIGHRLCIEIATVKNHVHSILDKLEVSRRGEAVALLRRDAAMHPSHRAV
jgi:DNA-binding NarL/FixJ family response regulator